MNVLFNKIKKFFTYEKRKQKIIDKIVQRILQKDPSFALFDEGTGKKRVFDFVIKIHEKYDSRTGKRIDFYHKYRLFISWYRIYDCSYCYSYDKNGRYIGKE
jgi:hypothetical protein